MRRLVACQPSAVENYLSRNEDVLNQHRIKDVLQRLEETWDEKSLSERAIEHNQINKQETELLLSSQKKCHKIRTGEAPFNLELTKLGLK